LEGIGGLFRLKEEEVLGVCRRFEGGCKGFKRRREGVFERGWV
jgi:hypothetical protein